jgi:hypothetical protein
VKKQITLAAVLDVKKKLESLPRIDNAQRMVTTREAIQVLKKQITELRNKGYTFVQIAEELSRHGIEVKESTLRLYRKGDKLERQSVSHTHRASPVPVSAVRGDESKTRPPVGSHSGQFEQLGFGQR